MQQDSDYIVYQPPAPSVSSVSRGGEADSSRSYPLTEGLWQQEVLGVLQMYRDSKFSPVLPG